MKSTEKLFDNFTATDTTAWEKAAREELQGEDPWKKLTRSYQGFSIRPLYGPNESSGIDFKLNAALESTRGARTWYNCPRVTVNDPVEANASALEHLQQGADGIFFELNEPIRFAQLLRNIEWPFCALNFLVKDHENAHQEAILEHLGKQKGTTLGIWYGTSTNILPSHPSFRWIGRSIASPGTADEIAAALESVVRQLGPSFKSRSADFGFRIEIGTDFFVEAAKLRAIRAAWQLILRRMEAPDSSLFIHACSPAWTQEAYQPHGNMLKATTAAMASILGGCDLLTLDAEDSTQSMMSRVARNVSHILREESHFSKVADPLSGSYLVENLTQQLTEQIWSKFQANHSA
ncbi:MAG: hypothetical protein JNL40_00430 [Cyclobacteriaceae bacterium]|nr:hypothetical protein [Cyclobacteriaceae bacterium]